MNVVLTAKAFADLDDIRVFISARNPRNARQFVAKLRKRCRALAQFPDRNPVFPPLPQLRMTVETPYVIFYRVVSERVEIVPILHGLLDLETYLRG